MSNTKVMVVTHKEFDDSIVPEGYEVIKVGKGLSSQDALNKGYLTEDTGENISEENPWYCELTAQYWAWKNLSDSDAKYIGLVHYRRYFFDYKKDSNSFHEDILSKERISELLEKYSAIISFTTVKYPGYGTLYKNKPKEQQDKHWVIIEKIIKENYPELEKSFEKVLYGKYTIWGNMLITKKDIFDKYSEWLFDVLKQYDIEIEKMGEQRIPRVDGFLSEYLLLVWFYHYYDKKQIYHLEVRNTETDNFVDYNKGIKSKCIKFIRNHYSLLCGARNIRKAVLLVKRRDKDR